MFISFNKTAMQYMIVYFCSRQAKQSSWLRIEFFYEVAESIYKMGVTVTCNI